MALEASWLTKHERRVLLDALTRAREDAKRRGRKSPVAHTRAVADADAFVCADLIRQLADR